MNKSTTQKSHLGDVPGVGRAAHDEVVVLSAGRPAGIGEEVLEVGATGRTAVARRAAGGVVGALAVEQRGAFRGAAVGGFGGIHLIVSGPAAVCFVRVA